MANYSEVWNILSKVNISDKIEKKNKLSYLSWAHCHEEMMKHYPNYTWEFASYEKADGTTTNVRTFKSPEGITAGVECTVRIGELSRTVFLPCMTGYSNKATNFPTSRDINDTMQRAYVKACALFGLGMSLYWGEDLPRDSEEKNKKPAGLASKAKTTPNPTPKPQPVPKKELEVQPDGSMKFTKPSEPETSSKTTPQPIEEVEVIDKGTPPITDPTELNGSTLKVEEAPQKRKEQQTPILGDL
jgi:hypothetical protein